MPTFGFPIGRHICFCFRNLSLPARRSVPKKVDFPFRICYNRDISDQKGVYSMNIAVDIDDTLTDTYSYFRPFTAEFFGISEEELDRRGISYSNLPAEWKKRKTEFLKKYCDAKVPATPFKADAAQGVAALRKMGHRIVIITGRTPDFYTDPYATTREELRRGGIEYDKLVCTLEKADACRREKIDLLIDDLPSNCLSATEIGVKTLLFDSPTNQNADPSLRRVHSWKEAVDIITS